MEKREEESSAHISSSYNEQYRRESNVFKFEQDTENPDCLSAYRPIEVQERNMFRNLHLQHMEKMEMAGKSEGSPSKKVDESNSLLIPTIMLPSLEKPPPPTPSNVYTSENMTIIDMDHQVSIFDLLIKLIRC